VANRRRFASAGMLDEPASIAPRPVTQWLRPICMKSVVCFEIRLENLQGNNLSTFASCLVVLAPSASGRAHRLEFKKYEVSKIPERRV
jgi:hypothetical protein